MNSKSLLGPVRIGDWSLRSRVVMAPMTRGFADDRTGIVGEDVVEYYRKRAADGIGLIITEGINPSLKGKGTLGIPGLYTPEQVAAWNKVTDAVHAEGGTIIAQLWHVGRLSHNELIGGSSPQAPSPVTAEGLVHKLRKPYSTPEKMTEGDIREVVGQFARAAQNAMEAGFDGVEVHAAHGYLIDQFNSEMTNLRTDRYGGDVKQRLTFMKEVLAAVTEQAGVERTLVRFSEHKDDMPTYRWGDRAGMLKEYLKVFRELGLQTLHPSSNDFLAPFAEGLTFHQLVRKHWDGHMIGVGNLTPELAEEAIREGTIDLAAFGRPLLANPDFVERVQEGKPLAAYDSGKHFHVLV